MSSIPFVTLSGGLSGQVLAWTLANGQTGAPTPAPGLVPWRTAQFMASGTFGSGGSVQVEGSNDGANWYQLSPPALTAPGVFASLGAQEFPRYARPHVTNGDGTTAIVVSGYLSC